MIQPGPRMPAGVVWTTRTLYVLIVSCVAGSVAFDSLQQRKGTVNVRCEHSTYRPDETIRGSVQLPLRNSIQTNEVSVALIGCQRRTRRMPETQATWVEEEICFEQTQVVSELCGRLIEGQMSADFWLTPNWDRITREPDGRAGLCRSIRVNADCVGWTWKDGPICCWRPRQTSSRGPSRCQLAVLRPRQDHAVVLNLHAGCANRLQSSTPPRFQGIPAG